MTMADWKESGEKNVDIVKPQNDVKIFDAYFDPLFQPSVLKVAFKIMTKNSKIRVQEVDLESVHSQENADMIINACHSTIIIECKS